MPNYIDSTLSDPVMAAMVSHLKVKYGLTQDRCFYRGDDFKNRLAGNQKPIQLYVVSHGADDMCAMSGGDLAAPNQPPISPGMFAHALIRRNLPGNMDIRIKLAMCFGNTMKPRNAPVVDPDAAPQRPPEERPDLISFARQSALILGQHGRLLPRNAVQSYDRVIIGGYDGEVHWAAEKKLQDRQRWFRDSRGKVVDVDKHSPHIKHSTKDETNRAYFATSPPGAQVFKPASGFGRGEVFCFFPFNFQTLE